MGNAQQNDPAWGPHVQPSALPYPPVPACASKFTPAGQFNLQICSDLHLEFYKQLWDADELDQKSETPARVSYPVQISAELEAAAEAQFAQFIQVPEEPLDTNPRYLALLGDIGNPALKAYPHFLRWCGRRFTQVFVVSGNHEAYGKFFDETKELIQEACREAGDNVSFCDRSSFRIGGVRVLGTTLWSRVDPANFAEVRRDLSDYKMIKKRDPEVGSTKIGPDDTNQWFETELAWLRAELAAEPDVPTIVLTHHAPSFYCNEPDFDVNDPISQCFCSNLDELFADPIVIWCFGHTHFPMDVRWGTTRVCSNPAGYPKSEFPRPYDRPYRPDLVLTW